MALRSQTVPRMHECTHNATFIPTVQRFPCYLYTHNATLFLLHERQYSFVCVGMKASVCAFCRSMCSEIQQVVEKYLELVQAKSYVPPFSYGRGLLRDDGGPNRLFFTYLFGDDALAISFLQDVKLIRSKVLCEYFTFLSHITPRTLQTRARVADCERSSLSFWALH